MSVAARLAIWQLVPLGGEDPIDYEIDRAQEFTSRKRGTAFSTADRVTEFAATVRGTLFTATERRQ